MASILNYFKPVPSGGSTGSVSPSSSDSSSKRKRSTDEEEGEGGKRRSVDVEQVVGEKRRSEEPLIRVTKKPFVDETAVDEVELEKRKNVVSSIVQEKRVVEKGDVVIEEAKEKPKMKRVVVRVKKVKDIQAEVERELMEVSLREALENVVEGEGKDEEEAAYEVEEILEYAFCKQDQVGKYFVKWVGWSADTNTWEPEANLECTDLLVNFYKTRLRERESMTPAEKRAHELPPDPRETFQVRLDFIKEHCAPPGRRELEAMFRRDRRRPPQQRMKALPEKLLNAAIDAAAKGKPTKERLEYIKEQVRFREMVRVRTDQQHELQKYEKEINTIDHSGAHVQVLNECDLEGPPRQMQYINSYRAAGGITIPDEPFIGCECSASGRECGLAQDTRSDQESCCSGVNGFKFAYTKHAKLRIEVGNPIYECNKMCQCGPACANRVVQNGRKHKLAIYRTDNGCGWGVKAMETIRPGSFVVEYVGEMITSVEAEERGKKYDAEGRTYLFDLDFNRGDDNLYVVDAAFYGNLSHFINHSCDPNLNIFNVYIDCLDPDMPRLCLFAKREIKKGEPITFDYRQSTGNTDSKNTVKAHADLISSPTKRLAVLAEADLAPQDLATSTTCRCGASNCRKILF